MLRGNYPLTEEIGLKFVAPLKKTEAPEHIGTTDWPPLSVAPGSALGWTWSRLKGIEE